MRSTMILAKMREAHQWGGNIALHNTPKVRKARINRALSVFKKNGFRGHAAWLAEPYKLHRIPVRRTGKFRYELYNLVDDAKESKNLAQEMPRRVQSMKKALAGWQESVIDSLQGKDYAAR